MFRFLSIFAQKAFRGSPLGTGRGARWAAWAAGGLMVLFLAGCQFNAKQSALDPHGPVARDQMYLFWVTVVVSGFIFAVVGTTMIVVAYKYREKPEDVGKPLPPQGHGNPLVEISLIGASIALLVIVAVPTLKSIWFSLDMPTDQPYYKPSLIGQWYKNPPEKSADEPLEITVYGYQWWWAFDYKQFGVVTANEFVIPAGKVVKINLRSRDVIHSFWLPKLAGKIDLMPGRANWLWLMADPDQVGTLFYGQCAQYCGEAHAYMLFRATAVSPADFQAWINHLKTPVLPPADGTWDAFLKDMRQTSDQQLQSKPVVLGAKLFFGRANCLQCHAITGTPAQGLIGPDLTVVGARTAIAADFMENLGTDGQIDPALQHQNLQKWIAHSQDIKPGCKMFYLPTGMQKIEADNAAAGTPLTEQDFSAIASFLQTLK
jgi:cytochrome c oxidase subunit 2